MKIKPFYSLQIAAGIIALGYGQTGIDNTILIILFGVITIINFFIEWYNIWMKR
ncbi:MAG: hypothetical protein ABIC57_03980 [bacterium]